ncbi:MAG: GatB/YqeY domain-containing protein [Gammaproteobacteria bacterium]
MLIRLIENLVSQGKDHIADLSLLDTINQDLKAAMLSKDVIVRDTLRMLIADIKRFEIDERVEADDTKVSDLINKNVKQRRDSIAQFKSGGREDLVATEEEQLNVILKYLPEQLSEKEIQELVQDGIAAVSAESMKDMGKLMGHLKPIFEGKADMSIVSKLVKELLS